jgi:hypothetical protein
MRLDEIPTRADLHQIQQMLQHTLDELARSRATTPDPLLTVQEAAEYTRYTRRTVDGWIKEGKPDQQGRIVRLQTLEFSPGQHRIPLSALLAFGKCTNIEVTTLKLAS